MFFKHRKTEQIRSIDTDRQLIGLFGGNSNVPDVEQPGPRMSLAAFADSPGIYNRLLRLTDARREVRNQRTPTHIQVPE